VQSVLISIFNYCVLFQTLVLTLFKMLLFKTVRPTCTKIKPEPITLLIVQHRLHYDRQITSYRIVIIK